MYPYTAGGTGLTACFPPWSQADGKLFENLASAEMRAKIKQEVLHQTFDWESLCDLATPQGVLITELTRPENRRWSGKRLSEIAADRKQDFVDAAMDLVLSERRRVETIYFIIDEPNVALQLRQPWIKIGTDAAGYDPDSSRALVHPRSYGTYPRILGKYVRDEHVNRSKGCVPHKCVVRRSRRVSRSPIAVYSSGFLCRHRDLRSRHDHRSRDLRTAASDLDGRPRRVGQWHRRGTRREAHRCQARPDCAGARL